MSSLDVGILRGASWKVLEVMVGGKMSVRLRSRLEVVGQGELEDGVNIHAGEGDD